MATKCTHEKDHVKKVKPSEQGVRRLPEDGRHVVAPAHVPGVRARRAAAIPRRIGMRGHIFMRRSIRLIRSAERGEDWRWCYIDETYL